MWQRRLIGLVTTCLVVVANSGRMHSNNPLRRHVEIVNESGEKLAMDWVNPATGEAVPYGETSAGEVVSFDSFVNHTFVIHPAKRNNESDTCGTTSNDNTSGACRSQTFLTITDDENQYVVISRNLEITVAPAVEHSESNQRDTATEIVQQCRMIADATMKRGGSIKKAADQLIQCLETLTANVIERNNEELAFQADLRRRIAGLAENYTCSDPTRETTPPMEERLWTHNGVTRKVGVLHSRPSSQIHILHNFISPEECDAVNQAAQPTLHRGTVADGKGGSRLSEARKAWQAGLTVNWAAEEAGDPIAAVSRRLLDYINHATGYNMSTAGQEDLMAIQYFGNGTSDPSPDRYMPHCDGDCNGLPHKTGGRVATMVMYCEAPELGGGTNFQQANVFVKPTVGAAAFFSYMNPETHVQDDGFTTHSGCPVLLGTKRIAVQWLRIGVDEENPWDSFDTNTVSMKQKR